MAETAAGGEQRLAEAAAEREHRLAEEYANRSTALAADTAALENRVREVQEELGAIAVKTVTLLTEQDEAFAAQAVKQERALIESVEKQNQAIAEAAAEREKRLAEEYAGRSAALSSETAALENRVREVREEVNAAIAKAESLLAGRNETFTALAAEQERALIESAEKQNQAILPLCGGLGDSLVLFFSGFS